MLEDFVKDVKQLIGQRLEAERSRYEGPGKDVNRDELRGRIQGIKQALIDLEQVVVAYAEPEEVPEKVKVYTERVGEPRARRHSAPRRAA